MEATKAIGWRLLAALLLALLTFQAGCHIVADAVYRDLQMAARIPQALADGVARDAKAYERTR